MTFPVLHLDGDAYDQGRQHGSALRDQIAENLDLYFERFLTEGKLEPAEARARADGYASVLANHPYIDGLKGLADGCGLPFNDLLTLNLRYELLYYQFGVCAVGRPDGCSAFAILPSQTQSQHLLLGQNWDWIPGVRGAVVHTREPDGTETLSFTEAGILGGKVGLNSHGLGLAINGLVSTSDDWSRRAMPFHVRCYDILRQSTLNLARHVVLGSPRPCSANFLLAQPPEAVVNIEAAPLTARELLAGEGWLVHANHFIDPGQLDVQEPAAERRPHSYLRQARLSQLIDARRPVGVADLQAALRDHDNYPDGLCRHENPSDPPEERYTTVTSVIMDLDERSLWLTDGPPCEHLYDELSLPHTALVGH